MTESAVGIVVRRAARQSVALYFRPLMRFPLAAKRQVLRMLEASWSYELARERPRRILVQVLEQMWVLAFVGAQGVLRREHPSELVLARGRVRIFERALGQAPTWSRSRECGLALARERVRVFKLTLKQARRSMDPREEATRCAFALKEMTTALELVLEFGRGRKRGLAEALEELSKALEPVLEFGRGQERGLASALEWARGLADPVERAWELAEAVKKVLEPVLEALIRSDPNLNYSTWRDNLWELEAALERLNAKLEEALADDGLDRASTAGESAIGHEQV